MLLNNWLNCVTRWRRTFNTVRHLRPKQAWYFFLRRGIGARRVSPSNSEPVRRQIALHPILRLTHREGDFYAYEFNFLNHSLSFSRDEMNWCPQEAQRLWRYNLHYFDYLRDASRPLSQKAALIDDWLANNPQGSEPAWEPYTASLRIVNWCIFFWSLPPEHIKAEWLRSLYDQARWLERNLELHILANHYFENIKAILFAAILFADRNSEKWLIYFQKKLIGQLREQFLDDGGHYERSPQYHCIVLEGCLELYAILNENPVIADIETLTRLNATIKKALHFLTQIITPDDDIPLFNDSASGAASKPSAILSKASALGFVLNPETSALISLPQSGLYGYRFDRDYFFIDCGEIGPAYQPGHTHCDFLSFVLMLDGQWLIVDSGVCEYEPGPMRHYVRSTAAHNTARVDRAEQSEIWGEFRVGQRATRIDASLCREGNRIIFEGAYRGFPSVASHVVHRRRAVLTITDDGKIAALEIIDTITADSSATHHVETFLHLYPALALKLHGTEVLVNHKNGSAIASLKGLTPTDNMISWHCAQFGVAERNPLFHCEINAKLPVTLSYTIQAMV